MNWMRLSTARHGLLEVTGCTFTQVAELTNAGHLTTPRDKFIQ